ncbi:MAG: FG-GAP-like repeat-containing protein, partial [bacterium]|nr:FG-GAP-like repeat-containing protein [bacterium]
MGRKLKVWLGTFLGPGPSERLDIAFFDWVFNHNGYSAGVALQKAKAMLIPEAKKRSWLDFWVPRYCVYELNLFGDPESPIFLGTEPQIDTVPPVISNIQAIDIGEHEATITWYTDEPSHSEVEYGETSEYGNTISKDALVKHHQILLINLKANTQYHYQVKSRDLDGNTCESGDDTFTTLADVTAPEISSVYAYNIESSSATINWTTDEPCSSQVEYGFTTSYGSETTVNPALVKNHSVKLEELTPNETYHYRVKSWDEYGHLGTSINYTFTTLPSTPKYELSALLSLKLDSQLGTGVGTATFVDLNNNGDLEIITAGPSAYTITGEKLWQKRKVSYSPPVVGDINGDGTFEIIGVGMEDLFWPRDITWLYAVNANATGDTLWRVALQPRAAYIFYTMSSPALADINGDNILDVIVTNYNGKVYAFNGPTGEEIWESLLIDYGTFSSPVIADIDKDGSLEILIGGGFDRHLYVLNSSDGTVKWSYEFTGEPFTFTGMVFATPIVANLIGDEQLEVIVPVRDVGLYVFNSNGSVLWHKPILQGDAFYSPVIGDIDKDGSLEIVVGIGACLYVFKGNGTELWSFHIDPRHKVTSPALADLDGDNYLEIIFVEAATGYNRSKLYILSYDGKELGNTLVNLNLMGSQPTIADIDGDGRFEVVIGTIDTSGVSMGIPIRVDRMQVFKVEGSGAEPGEVEWGGFQHDIWHTGLYGFKPYVGEHSDTFTCEFDCYEVVITSNCDIDAFTYNNREKEISFNAETPTSMTGYCKVVVPWDMLYKGFTVKVDDSEPTTCEITEFEPDSTVLYFTFTPGSHTIDIHASVCVGDINEDGKIRVDDILTVAQLFGINYPHPDWVRRADVNKDNKIRVDDILYVAKLFGAGKGGDISSIPVSSLANTTATKELNSLNPKVAIPKTSVMSVEPCTIIAGEKGIGVGDTFRDSIYVSGISSSQSLAGWDALIRYDPNVLEIDCSSYEEGPFLKSVAPTLKLCDYTDPGKILIGACFFPSVPEVGAVGSGTLAYLRWKVVGEGNSPIDIDETDTRLQDIDNNHIPFTAIDGYFKWSPTGIEEASMGKINEVLLQSYPNP